MAYALLFSGQGMQHPGMLPWLADSPLVAAACEALGIGDWRAALADAGWARANRHAQPLLTALALAAWQQLAPLLPPPEAIAGYSVGELAAFSAAGVFDEATAVRLAGERAAAMDRCAARVPGGLLSVQGLAPDRLRSLCGEAGCEPAIVTGPAAMVCGGPLEALARLETAATALGARCTRLAVDVASHTSWMREAAEAFAQELAGIAFTRPRTVLVSDTGMLARTPAQAREALAAQIAATVPWHDCMELLHARQVRCAIEIGGGRSLAKMWNDRWPDVPARACDDFQTVQGLARWVRERPQA